LRLGERCFERLTDARLGKLRQQPNRPSALIVGHREENPVYSGLVGTGLPKETRLVILRELQTTTEHRHAYDQGHAGSG
jgi:hypothetical protein